MKYKKQRCPYCGKVCYKGIYEGRYALFQEWEWGAFPNTRRTKVHSCDFIIYKKERKNDIS